MVMPTKKTVCKPLLYAALVLFLSSFAQSSHAQNTQNDFVSALNENNIRAFLRDVTEISSGQRPEMLDDEIINYFDNHTADQAVFKSKMSYDIPGFPLTENEMKLDKQQYITMIANGRYVIQNHEVDIKIDNLKIGNGARSATFQSTITEKGRMPFPKDPEKPDDLQIIPIEGKSVCQQRVIVSYNNFIQTAKADCETLISFDPFGNKPLVPR
jgi:hypothetical protein